MSTMTTNRISTHGPDIVGGDHACPYKKCNGRGFKNVQALNMHIGRVHTKVIPTASSAAVSKGLKAARNGKHRSNLNSDQKQVIVQFIAENRDRFDTKKAVFEAALDHAGATGVITNNSTNVDRYNKKADKAGVRAKRKYTRRAQAPTIPVIPTNPSALECVVTGPGLRIEFSAAILPTILHTIAMSIGNEK